MQVRCKLDAEQSMQLDKFADDKTEGSLLVDAENAFNKLNRTAALENIKVLF